MLLPDGAQKYLSKIFDDNWMRENGFLDEPDPLGTVGELLRRKKQRALITAKKGESVREVIASMRDTAFRSCRCWRPKAAAWSASSPNPICSTSWSRARVAWTRRSTRWSSRTTRPSRPRPRVHLLRNIFNDAKMVVVESGDTITGVITKIDLIEFLAERRA